jgi:hypothetical protein
VRASLSLAEKLSRSWSASAGDKTQGDNEEEAPAHATTTQRYATTATMKIFGPVLTATLVGLASAAPAIVWKNGSSSSNSRRTSHISNAMDARSLLSSVGITGSSSNNNKDSSSSSALSAVIFLVGRDADGSEGLSSLMASSSKTMMAGVQDRYLMADEIYYHVHGVESARTVARDARESSSSSGDAAVTVAEVSLEEFQRKLESMAQSEVEVQEVEEEENESSPSSPERKISKAQQKRRRAISEADVLVVTAMGGGVANQSEDYAAKLDAAIVAAIDSPAIRNVVLSTIRSTQEVKHARKLAVVERLTRKLSSATTSFSNSRRRQRRRLEDAAAADNADNQVESQSGIYYVNMTPNIFAGLLFFLMFVVTAHIGLTCMNMIEGQDVYVKKMPHIGREV